LLDSLLQEIMRIHAEVDVVNRQLATHGMKGKGKKVKTHLAIGRKPLADGDSEVFLMLSNNSNKQGVKYLIKNNVSNFFTKMINEGMSTIRFNEPPHDICIKCADILQLKSFLMVVKKVVDGKDCEKLTLSALQPVSTKQIEGPKKKLVVVKRGDYPTKGFPQTLQQLQVTGIRLARVDNRMLKLRNLVRLDLSGNEITTLPDNFDLVDQLSELNLSGNLIEKFPRGFCTGALSKSLKLLNLSENKIILLPNYFCNLRQLVTLNLNNNQLKLLPPSLGRCNSLKHFHASGNNLKLLPGSFSRLRLDSLELSANDFSSETESRVLRDRLENVGTMLEMVARFIVKKGITVDPEEVTPQLLNYLDSGMTCLCGCPVWNNVVTALVNMDLARVSTTISAGGVDRVCIEASLCSNKCLNMFQNNPYAF